MNTRLPLPRFAALLLAISLALLPACGGGSPPVVLGAGGGGGGGPVSVELSTIAGQNGRLIYSGLVGPVIDVLQQPAMGYNLFGDLEMGFFTFDLSQIPAGATIESATFEVDQRTTLGNPQATIGVVCLAHTPAFAAAPTVTELMATMEDPIRDGTGLAEVLSFTQQPGLRTMDVTSQVRRDRSEGRNRARFRLTANWALLAVGPPGLYVFETTPILRVTYR